MAKVTPLCPAHADGGEHIVKALRGSGREPRTGRDFYAYGCSCGKHWRQIRANQLKPGEQPVIDFNVNVSGLMLAAQAKQAGVRPAPVRKPQGAGYLCSRCHLPKKGHVCMAGKRPLDSEEPKSTAFSMAIPSKDTTKPLVVELPKWYVDAAAQTRAEMHTFVWAVEKAGIDWTSEFALEFMRRFNLTPTQASEMVQLFRSASAMDDQSAPRCDKCNFTALDDDGALVQCSGVRSQLRQTPSPDLRRLRRLQVRGVPRGRRRLPGGRPTGGRCVRDGWSVGCEDWRVWALIS